jgi:hypothetical protein
MNTNGKLWPTAIAVREGVCNGEVAPVLMHHVTSKYPGAKLVGSGVKGKAVPAFNYE